MFISTADVREGRQGGGGEDVLGEDGEENQQRTVSGRLAESWQTENVFSHVTADYIQCGVGKEQEETEMCRWTRGKFCVVPQIDNIVLRNNTNMDCWYTLFDPLLCSEWRVQHEDFDMSHISLIIINVRDSLKRKIFLFQSLSRQKLTYSFFHCQFKTLLTINLLNHSLWSFTLFQFSQIY